MTSSHTFSRVSTAFQIQSSLSLHWRSSIEGTFSVFCLFVFNFWYILDAVFDHYQPDTASYQNFLVMLYFYKCGCSLLLKRYSNNLLCITVYPHTGTAFKCIYKGLKEQLTQKWKCIEIKFFGGFLFFLGECCCFAVLSTWFSHVSILALLV